MIPSEPDNPGREPVSAGRAQGGPRQVLVLGVGNDMMGDEGIGVHVVRRLNDAFEFPREVEVVDGGVGGLSLLPVIRSADEVVIVDALDACAKPGSIFMFNSEELDVSGAPKLSLHDTGIMEVLRTAALLEEDLQATIIGVQPKKMDEFGSGLSRQVEKIVPRVLEIILDLLDAKGLHPCSKSAYSLSNTEDWNESA